MSNRQISEEFRKKSKKPEETEHDRTEHKTSAEPLILSLQRQIGNRAVQRLVQQHPEAGALDDETSGAIHQMRGGGTSLDMGIQREMSAKLGQDFSQVQVHTSPQADQLNQQLSSAAFTTGKDIFFKQGYYQPGSSSGQELIAHELTHVVQQSGSQVGSGQPLTLGEPGDAYEQEADLVSRALVDAPTKGSLVQETDEVPAALQRQDLREDEDEIQLKPLSQAQLKISPQDEEEQSRQMKKGENVKKNSEEEEKL